MHSVFRHTLNIVSSEDTLLTIATRLSKSAPFTLVCAADRLDDLGIEPAAEASWSSGDLAIGDAVVVSMRRASSTSSAIITRPVGGDGLAIGYNALNQQLRTLGRRGSFLQDDQSAGAARELHRRLQEGRQTARARRPRWDRHDSLDLCGSMLGLGIGLTPSGDDYLVGFLSTHLAHEGAVDRVGELIRVAVQAAPSATNAISAAAVLAASRGRAREELTDVIHAALDGNVEGVCTSLEDLLDLGSTSGTDMAIGVLDALHALLTT